MQQRRSLKLREDLQFQSQSQSNDAQESKEWLAHDPLSCNYYRLSDLEYQVAKQFDGTTSIGDVLDAAQSIDKRVNHDWIQGLVERMRSLDMFAAESVVASDQLYHRRRKESTARQSRKLLSPLAIRIPLFDPTFLQSLGALPARILFHRFFVVVFVVFFTALALAVFNRSLQHDAWSINRLVSLAQRFEVWLALATCFWLAKFFHELGHILACARLKVQSREAGIMLLCGVPCFYCDTSDAWRLESRAARATIAVAGVYFELLLASIAGVLWLFSTDGVLRYTSGALFWVCTVSSIAINLNPLLKYDGYFLLSDLWGIPNLSARSSGAMRSFLIGFVAKNRADLNDGLPAFRLLAFGFLSFFYRLAMLLLVLYVACRGLIPVGLGPLAGFVVATTCCALLLGFLNGVRRAMGELKGRKVSPLRLWCCICFLATTIGFVLFFPLPRYVRTRSKTRTLGRVASYVMQDSELVSVNESGAELEAFESQLEILRLRSDVRVLELEIEHLKARQSVDEIAFYQLPSKEEHLFEMMTRLQSLEKEESLLQIKKPSNSRKMTFVSLMEKQDTNDRIDESTGFFAAKTIGRESVGRFYARGTQVGWYLRPDAAREVVAYVSDSQVKSLRPGLPAMISWDAFPGLPSRGKVAYVATEAGESGSKAEVAGEPRFEVVVLVDSPPEGVRELSSATLKIELESAPLGMQLAEFLRSNLEW